MNTKNSNMKPIFVIIISLMFFSCGSQESIVSLQPYKKVQENIIEEPRKYLGMELNNLLNDFKQTYDEYTYDKMRIFMLSGLNFKFKEDVIINGLFDWKNSDFDYGGKVNENTAWDFEKLKNEKIRSIRIYKSDKMIYNIS